MDNRPIGIFDSGLGGLTTVREVRKILPHEDVVYFGDTERVPYGSRSRAAIQKYAAQDIKFLLENHVKMIVIACNTAASTVAGNVSCYGVPFADALMPAAVKAAETSKTGVIGVIGTTATVNSGAYENVITRLNPRLKVLSVACPLFVPLVENGFSGKEDPAACYVAEKYLEPFKDSGVDTLILGCTHYPILKAVIRKVMGPKVILVDSGKEAAHAAKETLLSLGLAAGQEKDGICRYYVSDAPEHFADSASIILGEPIKGQAAQVDIDSY